MSNATGVQAIYQQYADLFGTNRPMYEQFFIYVKNVFRGDFGFSFSQYPKTVADVIASSIWWTVLLQLPAILVGWLIGNFLGALAAYRQKGFDKILMPVSIFVSSLPAFGMAVILLVVIAITLGWFPTSGKFVVGFSILWRTCALKLLKTSGACGTGPALPSGAAITKWSGDGWTGAGVRRNGRI